MRWLLWLYPRGWRRRYGDEFAALLEQEQPSPSLVLDVVLGALDAHLHATLFRRESDCVRKQVPDDLLKPIRVARH